MGKCPKTDIHASTGDLAGVVQTILKCYIDLTNSNFIDNLADSNKRVLIKFIEIVRETESIELTGRKAKTIATRELIEKEQTEKSL